MGWSSPGREMKMWKIGCTSTISSLGRWVCGVKWLQGWAAGFHWETRVLLAHLALPSQVSQFRTPEFVVKSSGERTTQLEPQLDNHFCCLGL